MRAKTLFILLFGLVLFGCSASTSSPASPVALTETRTPQPAASSEPATPQPASQPIGCSVAQPEPTPVITSMFPPITGNDYSLGPEDAAVTLIEYCDFQAPICRSMAAVVSNVIHNHEQEVRFIFRPVPMIGRLDKSELAVQAVIAAGDQQHFWEMYDLLFQHDAEWDAMTPVQFEDWLKEQATALGLDAGRFATDLVSEATRSRSQALYDSARSFNLQTVPLLIINGQPQGAFALDYGSIESTVSLIALGKKQFTECPTFNIDPSKQYLATLHTQHGDVVLQLFPDKAPLAVNSFVFLARSGWFNDTTFHRVISGSLAQAGDPSGSGKGNPGYFFEDEIDPDLKFDKPGVVGMANQGAGTNGSQFFITYAALPSLDGKYTIFGQVLSGMEILEKLSPRDPQKNPNAAPGDRLLSVEIEER